MTIRSMALNQLRSGGFNGFPNVNQPRVFQPNQPSTNQNAPQTNASIRNAGSAIAGALDGITGRNATLEGRTSDSDVATVRVDSSRTIASMPPRDTTIDVQQAAVAQTNRGDMLTSSFRNVNEGAFSFSIEVGGRTHDFNINVQDANNNHDVQNLMAQAINSRNIGVTASVSTGVDDGAAVSTLSLTADRTGTNNAFTVTDTTGNLTAAMGVNTVTNAAQNAQFTLNGGELITSQSNEVNIAAGVNITIAGEGQSNITFGRTNAQSISAAQDLVSAINSAIRSTNPSDGRGSSRFLNDLIGMNITFTDSLSRIGINVQNNGQLSINQERLQAAAEDGSLTRFFENGSGFAARAERIANNAQSTRHYTNAAPQVNLGNSNFNNNSTDQWALLNLFG